MEVAMKKSQSLRFARSESWRDYKGVHSCSLIFEGVREIGMIEGDSGCGGMNYSVTLRGKVVATAYSLKEAKACARTAHLDFQREAADV
jgi:hypothetical protein